MLGTGTGAHARSLSVSFFNKIPLLQTKSLIQDNENELVLSEKIKDKYEKITLLEKSSLFSVYSAQRKSDYKQVVIRHIHIFEEKIFNDLMHIFNKLKTITHANLGNYLEIIFLGKDKNNEIVLIQEKFELNLYELFTSIDDSQPKQETEILQIFSDIANVLSICHKKQIFHGNIDPSNICLIHGKERPIDAQKFHASLKNNLYILSEWGQEFIINLQNLILSSQNKKNNRKYGILKPFSPPESYFLKIFSDEECKNMDVYSLGMCILNFCGVSIKKIQSISISLQEVHDLQLEIIFKDYLMKNYNWEIIQILKGMLEYSPKKRWSIEHVWFSLRALKKMVNILPKQIDTDEKVSVESSLKSANKLKNFFTKKFSPKEEKNFQQNTEIDNYIPKTTYKINTKNLSLTFDSKEDYKSLVNVKPTKHYKFNKF